MFLKRKLAPKKVFQCKIHHENNEAPMFLAENVKLLLPNLLNRPIVIVCIGTDRSTGDSLGPLVGTKLSERTSFPFKVYGTLDDPVHAMNLDEKLKMIKKNHPNAFIIGIDACLGRLNHVGMISVGEGPVKPGAGVNKELPPVGDIHMTGIVNVSGFMEYFVLQNTRLSIVMKMATLIANSLVIVARHFSQYQLSSGLQKDDLYNIQ
ncbi:spore protease YyaC [Fictibacillus sp. Mic-4]|uniref:spore protease YyaC n=1 Tax=Fictibacillus TaxID=1329200 RepID=UPI0003F9DA67|nr:spore protease YyaC [Fictibacillus gelatini]